MIDNIEKFSNAFKNAVEYRNKDYRTEFLYLAFEMLKKKVGVPKSIKLKLFNEKQDLTYNGYFRVETDGERVLFNRNYIQTDKSTKESVDLVTEYQEMDNDWLYPIKTLDCLCHELKHCFDYYNNSLLVIDKEKTITLNKELGKDIYMINPSEIAAFQFSYGCLKEILNEVLEYCNQNWDIYNILIYEMEKNMLPWVEDIAKRHTERVALAKKRLEKAKINYNDYYYSISKTEYVINQ